MFPGGSGRLRLVREEQPARGVLGGQPLAQRQAPTAGVLGESAASQQPGDPDAAEAAAEQESELEERREEDLLGVEIEITPAGKSSKRLSLLSGGEKSMTALAFLFAVFLARAVPLLHPRRGRGGARRPQPRPLPGAAAPLLRPRAVHRDHPPEAHDGGRRLAVRRVDGRRRRLQGALAPAARRGRPRCPRSPRSPAVCSRPRGARLERSVHRRRARCSRRLAAGHGGRRRRGRRRGGSAVAGCSGACARAWPRPARRSASEIQATLFGVLDEHTWERLEEALIMADVGARTTASVVATLESEATRGQARGRRGAQRAADRAARAGRRRSATPRIDIRAAPDGDHGRRASTAPARRRRSASSPGTCATSWACSVLLGAADTFRAAASEQLEGWARARRVRDRHRPGRVGPRARSRSRRSRRRARRTSTS